MNGGPARGTTAAATLPARLAALRARLAPRACQTPPADWLPVVIAGAEVGLAHPDVAAFLASAAHRFVLLDYRLVAEDDGLDFAARCTLLAAAAQALAAAGLTRGWRAEALDVRAHPDQPPLAVLERAACRTLGITTLAVHLNAFAPDGQAIVARRADHKPIDPGLWDNLVGGMVPAGESAADALRREALEEAGLDLAALALARGGRIHVTRRVPEGWQSEIVQVFDTVVPDGVTLSNRDGEVAAIERRGIDAVLSGIERDEFTLEAALVLLDGLTRTARSS